MGGARSKKQHFSHFRVPFDYHAHSLQKTVLPQTNGTDRKLWWCAFCRKVVMWPYPDQSSSCNKLRSARADHRTHESDQTHRDNNSGPGNGRSWAIHPVWLMYTKSWLVILCVRHISRLSARFLCVPQPHMGTNCRSADLWGRSAWSTWLSWLINLCVRQNHVNVTWDQPFSWSASSADSMR